MRKLSLAAAAILIAVAPCIAGEEEKPAEEEIKLKGKPISKWVKQLQSPNRGLQMRASRAFSQAPKELIPKIVPKLIPLLGADRENTRFPVAQVMGKYGPPARAAVPHLLPMLEGTQFERNRAGAAEALGLILINAEPSEEVEKVTQALIKVFTDKYSDVRREAVQACGRIGPAAKSCVPHLTKRFDDTEWLKDAECFLVRRAAALTAGQMGEHGRVHIDKLISMLHANKPVATEFIDAIGMLGPVHENVVPNIVDKLEKTCYGGYQGASGEQMANYAKHFLAVLEKFGEKSAPSVDFLTRLLTPKENRRALGQTEGILKVMAAIGPKAKKALPVIKENYLKHKDENIKKAAEAAVAKIEGK
jgi:hypothetical protein